MGFMKMQNIQYVLPYQTICCRLFSTSLPLFGQSLYRTVDEVINYKGPSYKIYPHKTMAKLLFMKKKKPSFFSRPPVGLSSIPIQTAASSVTPSHICSSKRVIMLNKLFMRYIPEMLATSSFGGKLYGYDIQFSHVMISANFGQVKVYWIPKGTKADDEVQKLLDEVSAPLQQEMIALRVMGIVPPIRFRKDKFHALMVEVDRRLKIADFGEDFVPTIFSEDILKRQLQLQTTLPVEVKDKLLQLESTEPMQDDEEIKISPMKMDIFGLNYKEIQNRVILGMKNKRIEKLALADEKTLLGDSALAEVPFKVEISDSQSLHKTAFLKYMRKIKNEKKKMLKEQAKELQKQDLLDAYLMQDNIDDQEDELYTEFVKNAFEDHVDDFDNDKLQQEL